MIIWYQHRKNIKKIKRYGHLIYASKKMKYAVLYVNQEEVDNIKNRLLRYPFISRVDLSYKPFVRTDYETKKQDKYEYKGFNMEL